MDDHVVGALHKGGVDRADRAEIAGGDAGGEERGVFLGDTDVMILPREFLLQLIETGAGRHRGGDADHARVRLGFAHEQRAKDILPSLGSAGRTRSERVARLGIEGTRAVEFFRILESGAEASALLRADVEKNRARGFLAEIEVALEGAEVMPVNRADIAHAVLLEERGAVRVPVLHVALEAATEVQDLRTETRFAEQTLQALLRIIIGPRDNQAAQDVGDRADVAINRPLIVIEYDDEALGRFRGVIERLHRDTTGKGRVADEGHDMRILGEAVAGVGEADSGGERRTGMAGAEDVVQALLAIEEAAQAARCADTIEVGAITAGEQFVHVPLVGHVEDEFVLWRTEDAVQRDRELDHAEIGTDVAAVLGRDGDETLADLLGEQRELLGSEGLDVFWPADGREE